MAGIRTFNTNLPHVFRFPEWTAGIIYPKGSIVAEETALNGVVFNNYYVAIVDVQKPNNAPSTNLQEWNLVFQDPGYDSEVIALLTDSDFIQDIKNAAVAIPILQASIDSEMLERRSADSDLQVNMDSERHDWHAADSDLRVDLDSERHDWKAGDSDIYHRMREMDSDIAILFKRTDSDEDAIQAVRTAVLEGLDSEIKARIEADSDFEVLVRQTIHDYLSNDSEFDSDILAIRRRIDSDFDAAIRTQTFGTDDFPWGPKPYITNTNYYIDEGEITNHTIGYLWVSDNTNDRIYVVLNGLTLATEITAPGTAGITTDFTDVNGVPWRRGALIEESPGDDADVSVYQNKAAALPIVTNANLYAVVQRYDNKASHVQQVDLDTAFRRTVTTVVDMDSDLAKLLVEFQSFDSDNDSELKQLRHDVNGNDSDIRLLRRDVDSDSKVIQRLRFDIDSERHDWQAADSDIYVYITKGIDSDIKLSLDHDSELFVKTDSEEKARRNADSDIYNGYTSVTPRWVKTEDTSANITGAVVVNFDGAGNVIGQSGATAFWFWNSFNDRLVIVDSDNTVIYNEIHNDEPIEVATVVGGYQVQYTRLADTLTNGTAQLSGAAQITDDVWNFRVEKISKEKNDGIYTAFIDSDLNLHEWDSDNTAALVHIVDTIQEEIHWRRSRDSDLQIQIWDNDSDIAYLDVNTMKFRGSLDFTKDAPSHRALQIGDVYRSTTAGLVVNDVNWKNLALTSTNIDELVMLTDSDTWVILNSSKSVDSENITNVDLVYNYRNRAQHRVLNKLHYAVKSDTLFFEKDSDVFYVFEGEALHPENPTLIEAKKEDLNARQARVIFNNAGPRTNGVVEVVGLDGVRKPISNSTGFAFPLYVGGQVQFSGVSDSEGQFVTITLQAGSTFEYGDQIVFKPTDSHNKSIVKCFDGVGFKRVSKIKMDLDSETQRRSDFDSDVNNGFIHGLDAAYTTTNLGTAGDPNVVWSLTGVTATTPGIGGRGIGGFISTRFDLGNEVFTDTSGTRITFGSIATHFLGTTPTAYVTVVLEGKVVYREVITNPHSASSPYIEANSRKYLVSGDSDQTVYKFGTETFVSGNYQYFEVLRVDNDSFDIEFTYDSEHYSLDQRRRVISDNFETLWVDSHITKTRLNREMVDRSLRDDSEYRARRDGDSDIRYDLDSEIRERKGVDSDHNIRINDNDSDIAYLYDQTVKYRGTIDPTTQIPDSEVKRGDLYVSYTNGVLGDDWHGAEGMPVAIGDALLYTDSDKWIFLGAGGGGPDSENIDLVPSVSWYLQQSHVTQRKLHWGVRSRTLFAELDSDVLVRVLTDHENFSRLIDGSTNELNANQVDLSFDGAGARTSGVLRYISLVDSNVGITAVSGTANTDSDSDMDAFIVLDSELQVVTIQINNHTPIKGDIIEYRDSDLGYASRLEYDGVTAWHRWDSARWLRQDMDSEFQSFTREIVTNAISGFRVGTIMPFAATDVPVGFRIADGSQFSRFTYPELYQYLGNSNTLPDLRNQFLRGWNDDSDGYGNPRPVLSQQDDEIQSHTHRDNTINFGTGGIAYEAGGFRMGDRNQQTGATGGNETRPVNTSVVYAIAMYTGAGIVYDSEFVYSIWQEHIGRIDSELDRIDSDWKRNLDSEIHDRKAADSDILALAGRTFVQSTTPNNVTPALRAGDTWIDTSNQRMYYYEPNDPNPGFWVQVIGSTTTP